MGLLCAEQDVGNLKKCTSRNSGTPVRRATRQTSQTNVLSGIPGLLCAEPNVGNIQQMNLQESWDSCAQNKTSEISNKWTFKNSGTPVRRRKRRKYQTKCRFRNYGTLVRRAKRRKFQKDALSRTLGPKITKLRSENRSKIITNGALGWLGKALGEVLEACWLPGPPRRATGRQTLVRWPALGSPRVPKGGPLFPQLFVSILFVCF